MQRSVLIALVLALLPAALHAQVPPDADWRTLESEHFRVTFAPGLEDLARHTAERAEAARARLAAELTSPPEGKIDIVLADNVGFSNALATPFPSNRIVLYANPPVDHLSLRHYRDWLNLVLVHELTHIFHLDQAGWLGSTLRAVFGRVPRGWPFFPALDTPLWLIEGLATHFESRLTGAGRAAGSYARMVVRTAILAGEFPTIDQAGGWGPRWPGAQRRYLYGALFLDYLTRTHGSDAPAELVEAVSGSLLPPVLYFDRFGDAAAGGSFVEAWSEWREALERRYSRLADSLRAKGLTQPEVLTDEGRWALHPRVSPEGGLVAYAAATGREEPATVLLDVRTGERRRLARRNQFGAALGPASWLPTGEALIAAQLQYTDPYHVYQDLYRLELDGDVERLTHGARLESPDVGPGGRRVVAVQTRDGRTRLVVYDLARDTIRPLTEARAGVQWALPRFSPDGSRIAVGRHHRGGGHDIVVLDTLGRIVRELTRSPAVDAAPTWSPDGRWVLFASDRSGIFNLYAYDLEPPAPSAPRLYRVTNVLTGAFQPDVSPDGRWIYFSFYRADGFHIARVSFAPETWEPVTALQDRGKGRAAEPVGLREGGSAGGRERPSAPEPEPVPDARIHPYSPWPSLRPRYWLPVYEDAGAAGHFFGARTSGGDLVGRHSYRARASVAPGSGRFQARLAWRWAGLGNPVLGLSASRDWATVGSVTLEDGVRHAVLSREDRVGLSATLLRRRWRSTAALTLGGELVNERLLVADASGRAPVDNRLAGLFARGYFVNAQTQPYSISREDGVSLLAGARWRRDLDPTAEYNASYRQTIARASGWRSFRWFGFADHVIAGRVSALWRAGPGARPVGIGGASGGGARELLGLRFGGPAYFLPVRGFPPGVRGGTRAWSARLEYRVPLALIGRGIGLWPVFFDRLSAAGFVDAGDAWCTAPQLEGGRVADCAAPGLVPLVGVGAELALDLGLFYSSPFRIRAGIGYPVHGPGDEPIFYIRFGPSF